LTTDSPSTYESPRCPDSLVSDGNGGCIPPVVEETAQCAVGYLSDGNGNCISVPPPVTPIPSSSPSACPCQGAIDEL